MARPAWSRRQRPSRRPPVPGRHGTTAAAAAALPVADARRQFLPTRSLDVQLMLMGGEWK